MAPTNNQTGAGLVTRPRQELVTSDGRLIDCVITRIDELVSQLADMRERYHVISPAINTSAMAPGFGAVLSVVHVDTAQHSRDFYPLSGKQETKDRAGKVIESKPLFGPSKLLINRVGAAAGISWLPFPFSLRTDDRKTKWVWEYTSTFEFWAPDGKRVRHPGTKEVDLRDGSALALDMTPAQLKKARPFGLELAQTKSELRALRKLGISQGYTLEELAKPFVVVQFAFQPDMSDAAVKLEVTRHYLGITNTLYPGTSPELPAGEARQALPEATDRALPRELGGAAGDDGNDAPRAATSAAGPREASFDDDPSAAAAPHEDDARFGVLHVLEPDAQGYWPIVLSDGSTVRSKDRDVAKAASQAGKAGKAIVLVTDEHDIVEEMSVLDEAAPPATSTGDSGGPVDDGQHFIADIKKLKTGTGGRGAWTLWSVIATTGESWGTLDANHERIAQEAKTKGWPVRIVAKENDRNPQYLDIASITLIDPRQGNLLGGQSEKY